MAFDFDIINTSENITDSVLGKLHVQNICNKVLQPYGFSLENSSSETDNTLYIKYYNDGNNYVCSNFLNTCFEIYQLIYKACPYFDQIVDINFNQEQFGKILDSHYRKALHPKLFATSSLNNFFGDYKLTTYDGEQVLYDSTKNKQNINDIELPFGKHLMLTYFNINILHILKYLKFLYKAFVKNGYSIFMEAYSIFDNKLNDNLCFIQIKDFTKNELLYLFNTILANPEIFKHIKTYSYYSFTDQLIISIKHRYKFKSSLISDIRNDDTNKSLYDIAKQLYNELYYVYYAKHGQKNKMRKVTRITEDNIPIMDAYVLSI